MGILRRRGYDEGSYTHLRNEDHDPDLLTGWPSSL